MRTIVLLSMMTLLLVGCNTSNIVFVSSSVHDEFPVPEKAEILESTFDNPHIVKGETFKIPNIGGKQGLISPQPYFDEIKAWGWDELEKEQLGHVYFFKKDNSVIALAIEEHSFSIYQMEEGIIK
ncbi:hypothetical protein [Bacillus alkalicellulosilyticus]|uniref:hypothetical protein n=1 Tax=Alkalihalobacterium alkalicellulosilyticum TaxID=1912214 RepID=UPI0009961064|nr:hypothetical protein [Bacillus alkalicellulosilyticus]